MRQVLLAERNIEVQIESELYTKTEKGPSECPCCLETYDEGKSRTVKMPFYRVRHYMHHHCTEAWFKATKLQCPLCRAVVAVKTPQGDTGNLVTLISEVRAVSSDE